MYYMVNVKDYGKVVVADTREACVSAYAKKMGLTINGDIADSDEENQGEAYNVTFVISQIQYIDISGNTYVYMGTPDGVIYKALFAENEELLFAKIGDKITGIVKNGILSVEKIESIDTIDKI